MEQPSCSDSSYHFLVLSGTLARFKTTRIHESCDPQFSHRALKALSDPPNTAAFELRRSHRCPLRLRCFGIDVKASTPAQGSYQHRLCSAGHDSQASANGEAARTSLLKVLVATSLHTAALVLRRSHRCLARLHRLYIDFKGEPNGVSAASARTASKQPPEH